MIRYFSLSIKIVTLFAGVMFFQCQLARSQEAYITPWFQFEMAPGWVKVDQGEQPPSFPSIHSQLYSGHQADVIIKFGIVAETLTEIAVIKAKVFKELAPGHLVLANRFFNTSQGFSAHEYYIGHKGNRFRYIDVFVPYDGDNYLGSFEAFIPYTDSLKTSDQEVLEMVNSVRPVVDGPTITSHPTSTEVEEGGILSLNVSVSSEAEYTVEWYRNGIPLGVNGTTLTITGFQQANAGNYWAVVKNFAGEDRSNTATVTWKPSVAAPIITKQPEDKQVTEGATLTLQVEVNSAIPYTINWYKDGALLNTTSPTLSIPNITKINAGRYWAVATNQGGKARSEIATVEVLDRVQPPVFIAQPSSQGVAEGASFQLLVAVDSTIPYTIQWFKDGFPLPANGLTLTIENFSKEDAGNYWAVAKAKGTEVSSTQARINLIGESSLSLFRLEWELTITREQLEINDDRKLVTRNWDDPQILIGPDWSLFIQARWEKENNGVTPTFTWVSSYGEIIMTKKEWASIPGELMYLSNDLLIFKRHSDGTHTAYALNQDGGVNESVLSFTGEIWGYNYHRLVEPTRKLGRIYFLHRQEDQFSLQIVSVLPHLQAPRSKIELMEDGVLMSVKGESEKSYLVEHTEDFRSWTPLMRIQGTGETVSVALPRTKLNEFFRVVAE